MEIVDNMVTKKQIHEAAIILGQRGGMAKSNVDQKSSGNGLRDHAKTLGSLGGLKGGPARAKALTKKRRKDIATYASLCAKIKRDRGSLTPEQWDRYNELKDKFAK